MDYADVFNRRIGMKGKNRSERAFERKKRSFERYFSNTINRELVVIDGVEQYAVFQDQNQNNNKDLSDDKYMIVENETNAKVGSYIEWRGRIGMVFTEEEKTIPTHKQFKTKVSNHVIKWMINGLVCGDGKGTPAFIQNQTLYTLGVSTSGNNSWIVNAKMMMYLQDNPETRTLKIGQRIFIGGEVYQIMFRDYVSRNGLINFLLEQDFVNDQRDDIKNEIADYYTAMEEIGQDQNDTGSPSEVTITGPTNAKIGSLVKYESVLISEGSGISESIAEWTIADVDHVATVVEQTDQYITVHIEKNFQKVGSQISIIGKTIDGIIGSKTVNIISPY